MADAFDASERLVCGLGERFDFLIVQFEMKAWMNRSGFAGGHLV